MLSPNLKQLDGSTIVRVMKQVRKLRKQNSVTRTRGYYDAKRRYLRTRVLAALHTVEKCEESIPGKGNIYHCASEWGLHFPEANGDCQSPVNINSREAAFDDKLNHPELSTNYVICRECDLVNNGNAVQIMFRYKSAQGFDSAVNFGREGKAEPIPKSVISGGPLPKNCEFELSECRFHWGREDDRGSEHTVNFKAFPMELHLLHWNCSQYSSYEEALGKPDGVCIVALFIQVGREHQGLRAFTEHLEVVQYKGRTVTVTAAFNPNCLLPDPALRDFWTYNGSLTTPPCCEKATWILFRYPLTISHSQMEEFRRLRSHHKGETPARGDDGILADNFRPTQPLNDRIVRASFL